MTISKRQVREIARKHWIFDDTDAEHAFEFVWEIICKEHDAILAKEPDAVCVLRNLDTAEHEVYDLMDEVISAISEN